MSIGKDEVHIEGKSLEATLKAPGGAETPGPMNGEYDGSVNLKAIAEQAQKSRQSMMSASDGIIARTESGALQHPKSDRRRPESTDMGMNGYLEQ